MCTFSQVLPFYTCSLTPEEQIHVDAAIHDTPINDIVQVLDV